MNEHEETLQRILCGELSAEDPQARDALLESPALARELRALLDTELRVAAAAREQAATLNAIAAAAPEDQGVEDAIMVSARAALQRATPVALRRPRVSPIPIGLAAAALLAVGLMLGRLGENADDTPTVPSFTLGRSVRLLTPMGPVSGYDEFQWEYGLHNGYAFELTLWNASTGDELFTTRRLLEARWSPPPELELPSSLSWTVYVLDHTGGIIATGDGAASLSR